VHSPVDNYSPTSAAWNSTSVLAQDRRPVVWNIHRVNFTSLPVIEGKACIDRAASTIMPHCLLAFSDRESALVKMSLKPVRIAVKQTISRLFSINIKSGGPHVVLLSDPGDGGTYTLIYCNGIRLDLAAHTFVLDASILPLTKGLIDGPLGTEIEVLSSELQAMTVEAGGAEVEAWKHLLVAFTERCRSWGHTSTCKYTMLDKVPASVEIFENPLCGCGEGIDLGRLSVDRKWTNLAPLMTRAAISPLFAVAYLDTVDVAKRLYTYADQNWVRPERHCAACHKPEDSNVKLLKCGPCSETASEVQYCGKACQVGHWKEHKKVCKAKRK
jgi:hypothetical protein